MNMGANEIQRKKVGRLKRKAKEGWFMDPISPRHLSPKQIHLKKKIEEERKETVVVVPFERHLPASHPHVFLMLIMSE